MGDVYVAEDPQIDRRVALKTVRLAGARDEEIEERKRRLVREAKAAGRLIHPHVVTLFDAGEEAGLCFLAFELVEGPDLAERLRQEPALTVGDALRIARETLEALDFAHQHGIIHRDIKPSNILLSPSAGVKVSDFGIAKLVGQTSELTMSGSVVGSPHYLSPEQIKGEELDGRSDLFSLGVVLYEMLARGRPFAGETITTLVYQILHTDPPAVSARHPEISAPVVSLVAKLMAKDREQRYATAREAVEAIRKVEASMSPAELAESSHKPDATAETRLIRTGPTVGVGTPMPPTSASLADSSATGNARRRRFRGWLVAATLLLVVALGGAGAAWLWFHHPSPSRKSIQTAPASAEKAVQPAAEGGATSTPAAPSTEGADSGTKRDSRPDARPSAAEIAPGSSGAKRESKTASRESRGKDGEAPVSRSQQKVESHPRVSPRAAAPEAEASALQPGPGQSQGEEPAAGQAVVQSPAIDAANSEEPAPQPDAVVDGGLRARLESVPKDSIVAVRGPGDSRFRTLGRADQLPGKDEIQFPSPGSYLVRVRRERMRDFVARVHAASGRPPAQIVARMREIKAKELALGDLQHYRAGEAIGFKVTPPSARVLVDGRPVGLARKLSGGHFGRGRWLELKPGVYRVSLEAPGFQRMDIAVEIFPGAEPAKRRLELTLDHVQ